jgi:anti-sigma factor RsiW
MNCFEARQEFSALWRKTAAAERRASLIAHLKGCEKCDHAFRVFAMTAPVLHGAMEPPNAIPASRPARREFSLADRPRRFASVSREVSSSRPNRWISMAAAAAIFVFAGSAAYLSVRAPSDTLGEELSIPDQGTNADTAGDPLAPEIPLTENDLAG